MRWVNVSAVVIAAVLTLSGCMRWFSPFNRASSDIIPAMSAPAPRCPTVVTVDMGRGPSGQRCVLLGYTDGHHEQWCADEVEARR